MADHVSDLCDQFGHEGGMAWGIGEVARSLDVPVPTLRSWGHRYGLQPSHRTDGGHRRYTCEDIDRLRYMKRLTEMGVAAREASIQAVRLDGAELHDAARNLGASSGANAV